MSRVIYCDYEECQNNDNMSTIHPVSIGYQGDIALLDFMGVLGYAEHICEDCLAHAKDNEYIAGASDSNPFLILNDLEFVIVNPEFKELSSRQKGDEQNGI